MLTIRKLSGFICLGLLCIQFYNCGRSSNVKEQNNQGEIPDSISLLIEYKNEIFCIPSPHRVAKYFIENNIGFENELILKPTLNSNYLTNFEKSLIIGIYGTNQGYQVLFNQDHDSLLLFLNVKDLTNSLGLLDAINQESLIQIEKRIFNPDTILYFIANSYRELNTYAQIQNKQSLSTLIITGGWIESFYLLTEMQVRNKNKNLGHMIVEHKFALDHLIKLLSPFYETNIQFKELTDKLVDLAYDLDAVEFEYQFESSETFDKKMLTIVKSSSRVNFTKEQLNRLTTKIKSIRYAIIS